MKIINKPLLRSYHSKGTCELCGKVCQKCEPHHIVARGMGGGRRLDVRCNLIRVGSSRHFQCQCHSLIDTKEGYRRCLEVSAKREGCKPEEIEAVLYFILNLDKQASKVRIVEQLVKLPEAVRRIVERELWALAYLTHQGS